MLLHAAEQEEPGRQEHRLRGHDADEPGPLPPLLEPAARGRQIRAPGRNGRREKAAHPDKLRRVGSAEAGS